MNEMTIAAFTDELEKIGFIGALGGAVRGGLHAAGGVARKALSGQSVGGLRGAAKTIGEAGKSQASMHNMAAAAQKAGRSGVAAAPGGTSALAIRGRGVVDPTADVLRKNRLVGGALVGAAGLGAGAGAVNWASKGEPSK